MSNFDMLQIVVEGGILIALLYLIFFKSYFKEKGKNLATKEDIREITGLVESVKFQLQYSLQAKLSLRAEEHDSLVEYFMKYHAWLSAITSFSLAGIGYEDRSMLAEMRNNLNLLHKDCDLAAGRMKLFVENTAIISQNSDLIIETIKLQGQVLRATFEFDKLYVEIKQAESLTSKELWMEKYQSFLKTEQELYQKFTDEQVAGYRELWPFVNQQRATISNHLRNLVTNA